MVKETLYYTVICDCCKKDSNDGSEYSAWGDIYQAKDVAMESDWIHEEGKDYCPDCYEYDDNDNLIICKSE